METFEDIPDEMTWEKALPFGKRYEKKFLSLVQRAYPRAMLMDGNFKYYDLWIPEIKKTIEVKVDIKSNETGNLVVEIEHYGKPTGLSITKATYWVFYDGDWIWIETDSLRHIVKDHPVCKFVGRGDTVQKKAYLIPKDLIIEHAFLVWDSDGETPDADEHVETKQITLDRFR